jgi:hypothetical protein
VNAADRVTGSFFFCCIAKRQAKVKEKYLNRDATKRTGILRPVIFSDTLILQETGI